MATCRRPWPTWAGSGWDSRCSRSAGGAGRRRRPRGRGGAVPGCPGAPGAAAWPRRAAARARGLRGRDRGLPWDAERVGMAALVAVALVFGVSSAVDWTWFVPANAALGLLAAGWVAGRPPLRTRVLSDRASGRTPPP